MALRLVYPALEIQDYVFQAVIEYHPGDTQDRPAILQQIRTPGTSTTATDALTKPRRWGDLHERARQLGEVLPPAYER